MPLPRPSPAIQVHPAPPLTSSSTLSFSASMLLPSIQNNEHALSTCTTGTNVGKHVHRRASSNHSTFFACALQAGLVAVKRSLPRHCTLSCRTFSCLPHLVLEWPALSCPTVPLHILSLTYPLFARNLSRASARAQRGTHPLARGSARQPRLCWWMKCP